MHRDFQGCGAVSGTRYRLINRIQRLRWPYLHVNAADLSPQDAPTAAPAPCATTYLYEPPHPFRGGRPQNLLRYSQVGSLRLHRR
jgi:hypothetical protein